MESEAGLSHMHGTSCGNLGRQWAKSRLQPRDYKPRMRPFALTMAVFDLAQSRAAANAPFKAHAFSRMRAMNQLDLGEQAAHIAVEAKKCLFAGNERTSEPCTIAFRLRLRILRITTMPHSSLGPLDTLLKQSTTNPEPEHFFPNSTTPAKLHFAAPPSSVVS
jgi:hypothetical protein